MSINRFNYKLDIFRKRIDERNENEILKTKKIQTYKNELIIEGKA